MITNYLNTLKTMGNFTYESIANLSGISKDTVKNIFSGKTEDPRFETISALVLAMGGSLDEMVAPDKSKDELKETSVIAVKELYEHQMAIAKETSEMHIANIRNHYEQHHNDLKENYERRLADKRELLELSQSQNKDLIKANRIKNIIIGVLAGIFILLFIMEIMHPDHGWLRY